MARLWHSLGALALLAGPAAADDLVARPEACQPVLTVQAHGCIVRTVLRCTGLSPIEWRAESFDDTGLRYASTFDADFVQIRVAYPQRGQYFFNDMSRSFSTPPAEIIRTGRGVEVIHGQFRQGARAWVTTGDHKVLRLDPPFTISGTDLTRLRFFGTDTYSAPLVAEPVDFMNYVDPVTGALLGGESLLPDETGEMSLWGQPVELSRPGEPGFDAKMPKFDCATLSFNETDEKADKS